MKLKVVPIEAFNSLNVDNKGVNRYSIDASQLQHGFGFTGFPTSFFVYTGNGEGQVVTRSGVDRNADGDVAGARYVSKEGTVPGDFLKILVVNT